MFPSSPTILQRVSTAVCGQLPMSSHENVSNCTHEPAWMGLLQRPLAYHVSVEGAGTLVFAYRFCCVIRQSSHMEPSYTSWRGCVLWCLTMADYLLCSKCLFLISIHILSQAGGSMQSYWALHITLWMIPLYLVPTFPAPACRHHASPPPFSLGPCSLPHVNLITTPSYFVIFSLLLFEARSHYIALAGL